MASLELVWPALSLLARSVALATVGIVMVCAAGLTLVLAHAALPTQKAPALAEARLGAVVQELPAAAMRGPVGGLRLSVPHRVPQREPAMAANYGFAPFRTLPVSRPSPRKSAPT